VPDDLQPNLLAAPPATNVRDGQPATGRYAGLLPEFDWSGLSGEFRRSGLWRRFHHKRWQYVAFWGEELFMGVAVVNLGWSSSAFAYVFDRASRKLVADLSFTSLSGKAASVSDRPGEGALAEFRSRRAQLRFAGTAPGRYQLSVTAPGLTVEAEIDASAAPPMLLALGPIPKGGCAHGTQKSTALKAGGSVTVGEQRYDLSRTVAVLDYSNGLLARDTAWRWASAHDTGIGFNLQQGYFGGHENVLWLDGQLIPLGSARFDYDRSRPSAPWRIFTDDKLLSLTFVAEGARAEHKNLLVASSEYVQPVGHFSGWVKTAPDAPPREVSRLLGVAEDHRAKW
jgi:hypothetical protein